MDAQTTSVGSGVDWTSIINQTIAQVPSWIAIAHNQPVVTSIPPGTQGGSLAFNSQGVAGSISPGILIAGVIAIVAVVLLLRK
jgi:hypothetical protein